MGRLAQATRRSSTRLRNAGQQAKSLRGSLDPERLAESQAFMLRMSRLMPRPADIEDLLDEVKEKWDPPEPAKGASAKGAKDADDKGGDPKQDLLRKTLLHFKRMHKLAILLNNQAKKDTDAYAFVQQPARDVMRAPMPTVRFTSGQMAEYLTLIHTFILFVTRLARRMKA